MFYWFIRVVVKICFWFFFPVKVYGSENIPKEGPFILASNHRSYLDPMILPVNCKRKLSFVAKEQLFQKKFLGFFIAQLGAFPIRRKTSDVRAIKEILSRLKVGRPVLIFPEGTRTRKDMKIEIQAGIGLIAVKSKLPVIPVYVSGTDKVLPPGSKALKRRLVTVTYGKPLFFPKKEDYGKIAIEIMGAINSLSPQ